MKKTRKIIGIIAFGMMVLLCACGGSNEAKETTAAAGKENKATTTKTEVTTAKTDNPTVSDKDNQQTTTPAAPTEAPTTAGEEGSLNINGWIFTGNMEHVYDGPNGECYIDGDVIYTKTDEYYYGVRHFTEACIIELTTQQPMNGPEYEAMLRGYLCDGSCGAYGGMCRGYEGFAYVSSKTGKKYALAAMNYCMLEIDDTLEARYNICEDYFWYEAVPRVTIETEQSERVDRWTGYEKVGSGEGHYRTNGVHTFTHMGTAYDSGGFICYKDEKGIEYTYCEEKGSYFLSVNYK